MPVRPTAEDTPPPAVVVDAGGEPWERVEPLLTRRVEALPRASVLELLATGPGVHSALPGWCAARGHALSAGPRNGAASVFRIVKNTLPAVPSPPEM